MSFRLTEYGTDRFVTFELTRHSQQDALQLSWDLTGLPSCVWPEYTTVTRADELWRSTCLELFIGRPDTQAYIELNFSPSGSWNAYRFSEYRTDMTPTEEITVDRIQSGPGQRLMVDLRLANITAPLLIGPAVVAETLSGELCYFALQHGDKPDFHDAALHQRVDHL